MQAFRHRRNRSRTLRWYLIAWDQVALGQCRTEDFPAWCQHKLWEASSTDYLFSSVFDCPRHVWYIDIGLHIQNLRQWYSTYWRRSCCYLRLRLAKLVQTLTLLREERDKLLESSQYPIVISMRHPISNWWYHTFQNPMFIHIDWGGNEILSILWSDLYRGLLVLLFPFPFKWFSTTRLVRRIINPAARMPRKYLFVQSMALLICNNKPYPGHMGPTNLALQFEPEPTQQTR